MKVLLKLRLYSGGARPTEAKNIVLEPPANSSLRTVLRNAIRKARWNENALRTRSIRKRDVDFDEDVDIDEDERPMDMAKYEVALEQVRPEGSSLAPAANGARQAAPTVQPTLAPSAVNVEARAVGINQPRMDTVEIVVKTLNNKTYKFTVGPNANETNLRDLRGMRRAHFQWTEPVASLMEEIMYFEFASHNLPISHFKFVFLGRSMRGEKTFAEYRLENGSKIEITL